MSRDDWLMLALVVSFLVLAYINLRIWWRVSGVNSTKKWPKAEMMGDYDLLEQREITQKLMDATNRQDGRWDDDDIQ